MGTVSPDKHRGISRSSEECGSLLVSSGGKRHWLAGSSCSHTQTSCLAPGTTGLGEKHQQQRAVTCIPPSAHLVCCWPQGLAPHLCLRCSCSPSCCQGCDRWMWGLQQTLDSCPCLQLLDMAQPRFSALVGSHSLEWRHDIQQQGRMEVGLEHQSRQTSHGTPVLAAESAG